MNKALQLRISTADLVRRDVGSAMSAVGPKPAVRTKQSLSALPQRSDVDLFRYREGVIDLYAEIPDGTLDLGVSR